MGSDVLRSRACWRTQEQGFQCVTKEGEEQHLSFFSILSVQYFNCRQRRLQDRHIVLCELEYCVSNEITALLTENE